MTQTNSTLPVPNRFVVGRRSFFCPAVGCSSERWLGGSSCSLSFSFLALVSVSKQTHHPSLPAGVAPGVLSSTPFYNRLAGFTRCLLSLSSLANFRQIASQDSLAGCSRRIQSRVALAGFTRWL